MNTTHTLRRLLPILIGILFAPLAMGQLPERVQALLNEQIAQAKVLAADPTLVKAVLEQNKTIAPEYADMTQEKWDTLKTIDPLVRSLEKSPLADVIRRAKGAAVSEAFLNDAQGRKVTFLAKTTNWSHLGKAKHDVPMKGEVWQGKPELDKSTGMQQIQFSVPILSDNKPVGSLVIGVAVSSLAAN